MIIGDEVIIKDKGKAKLLLILGSHYLVEFNGERIKVAKDEIINQDGEITP